MIISAPCLFCAGQSSVTYPPVTALRESRLAPEDEAIIQQIQADFGNNLETLNAEDRAGLVAYLTLYTVGNFCICDILLSDKAEAMLELAEQLSSDSKLKLAVEIIQSLRLN